MWDYQHTRPCDSSIKQYNCNIDIPRNLNSRDSFLRRKFKNRVPISCRQGSILSLPTISFEFHTKMAEKIDLEKCNFFELQKPRDLDLDIPRNLNSRDRVEVILVCISGRGLTTHQITSKAEKLFVDIRMDGRTHLSSVSVFAHHWTVIGQGHPFKHPLLKLFYIYWICKATVTGTLTGITCNMLESNRQHMWPKMSMRKNIPEDHSVFLLARVSHHIQLWSPKFKLSFPIRNSRQRSSDEERFPNISLQTQE